MEPITACCRGPHFADGGVVTSTEHHFFFGQIGAEAGLSVIWVAESP